MEMKRIIELFDIELRYSLIIILLLSFLVFIFIFTINWEDWFFGIKLDGLGAGLYLFIKGASAGLLAYLLMNIRGIRRQVPALPYSTSVTFLPIRQ